jgi:hypothetical protein
VTDSAPSESRARIARRVGSASAARVELSESAIVFNLLVKYMPSFFLSSFF